MTRHDVCGGSAFGVGSVGGRSARAPPRPGPWWLATRASVNGRRSVSATTQSGVSQQHQATANARYRHPPDGQPSLSRTLMLCVHNCVPPYGRGWTSTAWSQELPAQHASMRVQHPLVMAMAIVSIAILAARMIALLRVLHERRMIATEQGPSRQLCFRRAWTDTDSHCDSGGDTCSIFGCGGGPLAPSASSLE
jgi:hypothetical protein